MALVFSKLNGTPTARSQYNDFGLTEAIADDNVATGWSGGFTYAAVTGDFVGFLFPTAQEVRKLEVVLYSWGKTIVVGYSTEATWPGARTGFTVLRTIDVTVTPNDDLGVPWARLTKNTILLPAGSAGRSISISTDHSAGNPLALGGSVDRLRVMEMTAYNQVDTMEYTKESGTPSTNSAVVTGYDVAKIADGTTSAVWLSNEGSSDVANAAVGYLLPTAKAVTKIEAHFYSWGPIITVLYADSFPALVSGFTVARTIDVRVTPNDDMGLPWQANTANVNTILLPGTISAKAWALGSPSAVIVGAMGTGANNRIGMKEMSIYTTPPPTIDYTKIVGTVFAKDTYIGEGSLANLIDGNTSSVWHGYNANESSTSDFLGFTYDSPQAIRKLEINFMRWGKTIGIGIADAIPASKTGLTSIRLIDTKLQPLDDAGIAWTRTGKNTIILPAGNKAKVIAIYSNDNLGGPLSEGGMNGNNTRESVYEIAAYVGPEEQAPKPSLFTQVNGTAFATSVYDNNNSFRIAYLNNGTTGTYWASGNTANGQKSEDQVCGIAFSAATAVHRVVAHIDFWGKEIVFGYGETSSGSKSDFTVIRRIDTRTTLVDDLGVPIGVGKNLTFDIPLYPRDKAFAMFMDTPASNGLADMSGTTGKDYAQVREITMYSDLTFPDWTVPDDYVIPVNPEVPAVTLPSSPFSTDVLNWTRTEFKVAGDFQFTPADNTTLVLAILQGAGSGGHVAYDLSGNAVPYTSAIFGGATYLKNVDGSDAAYAGGGVRQAGGEVKSAGQIGMDWLRYTGLTGAVPPAPVLGNTKSTAGALAQLGGTAGVPYSLTYIDATSMGLNADFTNTTSAANYPVASQSGFQRNSSYGWYSTNKPDNSSGYVNFQPKTFQGGAKLKFTYVVSSEGPDRLQIIVGGVTVFNQGGQTSGVVEYTIPTSGSYTISFRYNKDGSVSTAGDQVWVTAIALDNTGYPVTEGGSAGGRTATYLLPRVFNFRVGKGGIGAHGGQPVQPSAIGTRGSGGAGGADGGDGVVIFYEYKGPLKTEALPSPQLASYNNVSTEGIGSYKTTYINTLVGGNTAVAHKLRPRTKTVFALVVGAGGGRPNIASGSQAQFQNVAARVFNDLFLVKADSGLTPPNYNSSISGGSVSSDIALLEKWNGASAYVNTTRPSNGIVANYGMGAGGVSNSYYGGSDGAVAFFAIGANYFGTDRTLNVVAPGPGYGTWDQGNPGVVMIYETEIDFGVLASQVSELILQISEHHAVTQTSQVAELILQNTGPHATTQTSQVAELILIDEPPHATTQTTQVAMLVLSRTPKTGSSVSSSFIEVVTKAEPGRARVSQSVQSVLVGSERAVINTSQTVQMLLIREDPTNIEFMDFGVVRYPNKNELYLSDVCTIASVGYGVNVRIQLEGWLPLGSTLIINGVEIGSLTAVVQDGDRVQLKSGITNWFDQRLILYAYITRGNQIIRDHAGYWTMLQGDLSPRKRAIISAATKFLGMKSAMAGAKLIQVTVAATKQAGIGAKTSVSAIKHAGLGAMTQLSMLKDAGLSILSAPQTASRSSVADAASNPNVYQRDSLGGSIWNLVGALKQEAQDARYANNGTTASPVEIVLAKQLSFTRSVVKDSSSHSAGWGSVKAPGSANYGMSALERKPGRGAATWQVEAVAAVAVDVAFAETGYNKIGANGFVPTDMAFVMFDYSKSAALRLVDFISGYPQTGTFFRPGYVYTPSYVSTQSEPFSFTTQENDKVALVSQLYIENTSHHYEFVDQGYVWRSAPNREPGIAMSAVAAVSVNRTFWGGFGFIDFHAPNHNVAETEWVNRGNQSQPGRDRIFMRQEYNRASGLTQVYAKRDYNVNLIPVQYLVRKANILLYGMKPILYQAGKNRIDKAKFYMGFTTQAEVNAFIANFMRPTTKVALDGYVYRVAVDEALVCEVRGPNMPVAWLLHGG